MTYLLLTSISPYIGHMDKRTEFIEKAVNLHGNKYGYDSVVYKNCDTKIQITCPDHGIFNQTPYLHLNSGGCPKCVNVKRKQNTIRTREQMIQKFRQVHGDIYDYSLVEKADSLTKVKIICSKHGIFEQTPSGHIAKYGCKKCGVEKTSKSKMVVLDSDESEKFSNHDSVRMTKSMIIEKLKAIHLDKYDYSLAKLGKLNDSITIICNKHGEFSQQLKNHLNGQGCKKCGTERTMNIRNVKYCGEYVARDLKWFLSRCKDVHGDVYDYSLAEYVNGKTFITINCRIHGSFIQTPKNHLKGNGCPNCGALVTGTSKGATTIGNILMECKIDFMREKTFETCKNIFKLPFDFYLPEYDALIEFDGRQHFDSIDFFGGDEGLLKRQHNDKIKTDWANDNNKQLLRIRYDDDIAEKLSKFIDRCNLNRVAKEVLDMLATL